LAKGDRENVAEYFSTEEGRSSERASTFTSTSFVFRSAQDDGVMFDLHVWLSTGLDRSPFDELRVTIRSDGP
jgi:hypothetical protein